MAGKKMMYIPEPDGPVRVGSLLEVGIGFHMELTGRENIFMNGASGFIGCSPVGYEDEWRGDRKVFTAHIVED